MFLKIVVFSFLAYGGQCLNLDTFYKYMQDDNSSTSNIECQEQRTAFLRSLKNGDEWALRMLDSYGRIPKGATQGNTWDLGMYDQCLDISEEVDTIDVKGKYCYAGLVIPVLDINLDSLQINEMITKQMVRLVQPMHVPREKDVEISVVNIFLLAACVPDACFPSDFFGELGVDLRCQTKDENRKLNAGEIACLCFLVIVACIVIASTIYDVYLQKASREPAHIILLAFSAYTNGRKIIKTTQESDQIHFFNGMKVLSMFWVIMGHRYTLLDQFVVNKTEAAEWKRKWYAVYVLLAPLAVDTFFFISGALLAYTFLKTMRKPNQKFNILVYYLHRFIRLTPALVVLYFFQVTLASKLQDGPLIPSIIEYMKSGCLDGKWWSFFLYIQNYVATDNMCMAHTWYLSVDMQFYLISPLLLLPMLYWRRKIVYAALPILVLIVIVYTILIFYFYDITLWSDDYENLFYYVTHTRLPPWLIGLIFGAFLLDYQANKQQYQIKNKTIVLAAWGVAIAVIGFIFFFQDDVSYNHTRIKSTFFFPLQRPLWALCLSWISYACLSQNAGLINTFLSMPLFQILSKVTYSTYLLHMMLVMLALASSRTSLYFTDYEAIRMAIADICISYAIGTLWTLAFESPILVIEKIVFRQRGAEKRSQIERNDNRNIDAHETRNEPGTAVTEIKDV